MADCSVIKCTQKYYTVLDIPTPGSDMKRGTSLCEEHYRQISGGDVEWVWQFQGPDPNAPAGREGSHVVLIGDDLLPLNEWVVEKFEGFNATIEEASSTDPAEGYAQTWTIVARKRGKSDAEDLRLVLTPEQFRELINFQG